MLIACAVAMGVFAGKRGVLCVCSLIAEIIFEFRARAVLTLDTLRIFLLFFLILWRFNAHDQRFLTFKHGFSSIFACFVCFFVLFLSDFCAFLRYLCAFFDVI